MEFHPYEAFDNNKAQRKAWAWIKQAFKDDPGVAYYRYPIFYPSGKLNREPDILILHRELGLWVIECKGCYIHNIASIQGHEWKMNNWHSEIETPVAQAEDQMFAIKNKFTASNRTHGLVSFNFRVVLPLVSHNEWQSKGFHDFPSTQGVVLFAEDLTPKAFKEKMIEGSKENPQRMMTDENWKLVKDVLGGTLPIDYPPHPEPPHPDPYNPIRVIRAMESELKKLDQHQQKVAFEIPPGPQRIRGLAGTGKTVLFAKRIAKMHARNPEWKLAFVFFTQSLYVQITKLIGLYYHEMTGEEPNWMNVKVLHAWGAKGKEGFYRTLALKCGKKPKSVNDVKDEIGSVSPGTAFEYICNCLEEEVPKLPVLYDAILIDEGQDLPSSFYRLARGTLSEPKRLYWAYDEAQGIGTLTVPKPLTIFGLKDGIPVVDLGGNKLPNGVITAPNYESGISKAHNMNRCYRTPKLLLMSAHAVNMGLFRQGGPLQGVTNQEDWEKLGYDVSGDFRRIGQPITITRSERSSPHLIDQKDFKEQKAVGSQLVIQTFKNEFDEQNWIAEQVANDIIKLRFDPCDILITGPTGNYESEYFQKLKEALSRHKVNSLIAGVDTQPDIFWMDGYVTIAPISRSKGNEAWKVYACRFQYATQPLLWKQEKEIHKRNEAFVALTRARVWCVATGLESPIFNELQQVIQQSPNLVFPAFNKTAIERNNDENDDVGEGIQGELELFAAS
ncbi:NERD domain-containing protein [Funiculus sociatus GB2-A5]|uniref:NERD domain-containing protein n=1 Tax=Funiculus sociatus GB2-A5 TaxID=2933946 RepID=A0ABV0JUI9_9CYAN|nr:nuclease-related domain-containing DEAD/DEAH box helicase [Trichocoleus sp. FACHB-6]MBD2060760.1 NERD domain-containing protein [Trichocoleus sp. FACHB-6]